MIKISGLQTLWGTVAPGLLMLLWFGVPACGSSSSETRWNGTGGSTVAGTSSSGGSQPEGGASGANAAAGAKSGGGSDAVVSGASSGGKAAGGASSGGNSTGGTSGSAGAGGSGGALGRGCPTSAPSNGAPCPDPTLLGLLCFYDDCAASGVRKKASCITAIPEIGNPVQQWATESSACESFECLTMNCEPGQACVIFEGGARFGQCAQQRCGAGSIECNCVTGCFPGCKLTTIGPVATFTCNTCADPRGCP